MVTVGIDSYVTELELVAYATARGITITADNSVLLIKAMDYLDTRTFIGNKTVFNQPLQFPRVLCTNSFQNYDYYAVANPYGYNNPLCEYDSLTVPNEIKKAQCIASLLIDSGYDLQSTLTQAIKREKVSVLETEYQDNSNGEEQHRALNDILKMFVFSGSKVVRS